MNREILSRPPIGETDMEAKPENVEAFLAEVCRQEKRSRYTLRKLLLAMGVSGTVAAAITCGGYALGMETVANLGGILGGLAGGGFGLAGGAFSIFSASRWQRRETARKVLAQIQELRMAGMLCQLYVATERTFRPVVSETLVRLLPQIRASDAAAFSAEDRLTLYQLLTFSDVPLIMATLKALEQIGDGKALPYVARMLAKQREHSEKAAIQAAALACMEFLEAREAAEEKRETLLRPSDRSQANPQTLLHPATYTSEQEPQQLLRASTEERP